MILFSLFDVCFVTFTNCLLNADAICWFDVCSLFLKVIVLFGCWGGFLFARLLIVFQSMCVFCLWSQCSSSLVFQMLLLCVDMRFVISSLRVLMFVSFGFCRLKLSLVWIFISMCSGSICGLV